MGQQIIGSQESGINTHCEGSEQPDDEGLFFCSITLLLRHPCPHFSFAHPLQSRHTLLLSLEA